MTSLSSYLCVICLPVFILLPQLIRRSVDLWLQGSISNEGHFSRTHSWQLDSRCFHTTGEHDGAAGPKTKPEVIWRGTSSSTGSHLPWQIICFHHLHFPLPRDNFKFEFRPLPCLVSFPSLVFILACRQRSLSGREGWKERSSKLSAIVTNGNKQKCLRSFKQVQVHKHDTFLNE